MKDILMAQQWKIQKMHCEERHTQKKQKERKVKAPLFQNLEV